MKKIFFSISTGIFFCSMSLFSQNYIAVQSGAQVSLFTFLENAIAAANVGDDIYLPGGIVQVHSNNVVIDKKLNLYGVGYNPVTTASTGRTLINALITFEDNADGSLITGVHVSNITAHLISNLTIKRCLTGTIDLSGVNSNIVVIETFASILQGNSNDDLNVLIDRCVLGSTGVPYGGINYITGLTCKNSILIGNYHSVYGIYNSFFENSILFVVSQGPLGASSGNVLSNCIFNWPDASGQITVNPVFSQGLDATFVNYGGGGFDPANDYHLKPGSPGIGAGTDGTDIGLFGTPQPFKDGGLPDIPHFVFKSIAGSTDQNGKLQINIQVQAQDY